MHAVKFQQTVFKMSPYTLNGFVLLLLASKSLANFQTLSKVTKKFTRPIERIVEKGTSFAEMAAQYGYKTEQHEVRTEDGYILTMHRVPPKDNSTPKLPVFINHGLFQASECYLDSGPFAPVLALANDTYDVWCGNARGNYNSRSHTHLDPDKDSEFWQFSFHEIGRFDNPAMIDYVLNATNSEKLIMIGASQGGGTYFIMNSERPEYAKKISLFVGLAPATRLLNEKSVVTRTVTKTFNRFRVQLQSLGVWEALGRGSITQTILSTFCQTELNAAALCSTINSLVDYPHIESITPEIQTRVSKHLPAGTSVQNLAHYGQAADDEKFSKFDFGPEKNMVKYGRSKPPAYNFSASTAPTVIFHGKSDHLMDPKDMDWTVEQLPNVLEYIIVKDPLWNHFDMASSRFWAETIYAPLRPYLMKYDKKD